MCVSEMCRPTTQEKRLLAAETFFHTFQASREVSNSEICFDTPVNLTDIKILSPSMYLSVTNGEIIFGATDPSHFPIQFRCNNIHRPNSTTYEELGLMNYDENSCTKFSCSNNIWTDKLIVSGRFLALTVVVYGSPKGSDLKIKNDPSYTFPQFTLTDGMSDIITLANDYYMDAKFSDKLSCLQLNPNYF